MKSTAHYCLVLLFLLSPFILNAQVGLTVTPPRNYYTSAPGKGSVNKVIVTNSSKTQALSLTVSLSDWKYDENGNNVMGEAGTFPNSCANWVSIAPQSYISLAAGESKEIEVSVKPPAIRSDTLNVHTAMLFITQTNPVDSYNQQGALVKVAVRSGIKIYHRYDSAVSQDIDFTDYVLDKKSGTLALSLHNRGNTWTDGTITTDLVNQNDGTKHKLEDLIVYTMPGDKRVAHISLPKKLTKGKYIATSIFAYGDDDTIKMAELAFEYE